jgi:hypothetical protein
MTWLMPATTVQFAGPESEPESLSDQSMEKQ